MNPIRNPIAPINPIVPMNPIILMSDEPYIPSNMPRKNILNVEVGAIEPYDPDEPFDPDKHVRPDEPYCPNLSYGREKSNSHNEPYIPD